MASLTIRNLEDPIKAKLRVRAAIHGQSMEEEVRSILRAALAEEPRPEQHIAEAIHERFAKTGGFEMPEISRGPSREPPDFSE